MIQSNAPADYDCPICLGIKGVVSDKTLMRPSDVVFSDETVTVFINSFFVGKNAGHAIIVPSKHFENIYDLPDDVGHRIMEASKNVAVAMKEAYLCDGITIRQNNEPAGDQHAFHYHLHVFPRYVEDGYNSVLPSEKRLANPEERETYAIKLKAYLANV